MRYLEIHVLVINLLAYFYFKDRYPVKLMNLEITNYLRFQYLNYLDSTVSFTIKVIETIWVSTSSAI